MTGEEAITRIETEYPDIGPDLHDELIEGLLHCQMHVFTRLVQERIDEQDRPGFHAACKLWVDLWRDAAPDLENTLNVSFLEHLDFTDGEKNRSWAYRLMPVVMRDAFEAMAEYNRQIEQG